MTTRARFTLIAVLVTLGYLPAAGAEPQVKLLQDFEQDADLKLWEFKAPGASLSDEHTTRGRHSLKISADQSMSSWRLARDWSGYDALELDVFVEGDAPVPGNLMIIDAAGQKAGGYWNRHNGTFNLRPGANTLSIPVNGLYRGEAGSRGNGLASNIDPAQITLVALGFERPATPGAAGNWLYLDALRLVKESRPPGILAFDFGPESQAVSPGFTPVGPRTVFGKNGATAGFKWALPPAYARDDTFPTRLYQDFVSMDDAEFDVALPDGKYGLWVVFDDCGYWGGEQARFRRRSISVNGQIAWQQDRGADGPADYLYRFEKIEPLPGQSVWDTYVRDLFKPARFEAQAVGGKLAMRCQADGPLACKVAAVIVYPLSRKAEAEQWVAEVEDRNRREFESRAVFLGPKPVALTPPAEVAREDLWIGFPSLEQGLTLCDAPGPAGGALSRTAAQGQRVSMTFAVRPLKDVSGQDVQLTATDLAGEAGTIPAAQIDLRYVHHAIHRGPNDLAYTIGPDTLRPVAGSGLRLPPQFTRQFWLTVHVPPATPAGVYKGEVTLRAGPASVRLPLKLRVVGFALDEPDFAMAFFGADVPAPIAAARGPAAWRELFRALREAGMNTLSGGPNIPFAGLSPDGRPLLDFAACDEYFRLAREAGFTRPVDGYGGPALVTGLNDGHVIGDTGRAWEKKTGKPFGELLRIVWSAVRDHAEQEHWPPLKPEMVDEPRVVEGARANLELLEAYRKYAPWVDVGGSYSVEWGEKAVADPFGRAVQDLFRALRWSALNLHAQVDLDKARQYGKELWIYNQGLSRYSFGAYQWAEMHKGVKGRLQWHLLALQGYQFFDLDAREPDTALINWGREGIIPTLHLARCREGSDDLRYAATLWNRAEKSDGPAAAEAKKWLEGVSTAIGVGQRTRPPGFMDDEAFREGCITRIEKLPAAR